ncbi:5-oxoprolinase subunit PxpB [Metallumcola ferriviriculae]|uniref:5-oxoprolinase subunit PxpB n=1 Tax=Metallumcola ferriviriculae TaxID=3039180 RepID=A0AAU0UTT0_9FIRM|nr:5-oxoprolinase subunit PxpB [Desulfitibacteraceae bacterium MK1]
MAVKYKAAGDISLLIEFENEISEKVNAKVRNLYLAIEKNCLVGVEEVIPTYRSLLINYNPLEVKGTTLIEKLKDIESRLEEMDIPKQKVVEIPTLYGGEFGPDLQFVADYNKMSAENVIKIHSQGKYLIYMLGFTPGFPYLGGMSERIATPRLNNPRIRITAGSVGIAGTQTGIYPIESPGGWRLIGRTPIKLFNPDRHPYFLLQSGDYLQFTAINETEYNLINEQVDKNQFQVNTTLL